MWQETKGSTMHCGHCGPSGITVPADHSTLKPPPKVFIEKTIDDRIDAAVEKGQPVSYREHIAAEEVYLLLVQFAVVRQQHQSPQWQPRQHEKNRYHDEHFDDLCPALGTSSPDFGDPHLPQVVAEFGSNAAVHDTDEHQRHEVHVNEDDHSVDLTHL